MEYIKNLNNKNIIVFLITTLAFYYGWLVWNILSFPAVDINVDTYYYISLATSNLYCDGSKLYDAFTVGFLIPAMLASAATFFKSIGFLDLLSLEVLYSKIIVTISYAAILISCISTRKDNIKLFSARVFLATAVFMSFVLANALSNWSELVRDGLSLNGELVCVGLISIQILTLDISKNTKWKYFLQAIIFVLVANTKIQAAPISLAVMLLMRNKIDIVYSLSYSIGLFSALEYFLYSHNIGLVNKFFGLFDYIKSSDPNENIYDLIIFRVINFWKTTLNSFRLLPATIVIFLYPFVPQNKYFKNKKEFILLFITVILCVNIPGRSFVHYSILYWIPVIFFIRNTEINFGIRYKWGLITFCSIWILSIFIFHQTNRFNVIQNYRELFNPYKKNQLYDLKEFMIKNHLTSVYINSWEYSAYSQLKVCLSDDEFATVSLGLVDYQNFYKKIFSGKYDAIIELNSSKQISANSKYSLNLDKIQKFNNSDKFCELQFSGGEKLYFKCKNR